MTPIARRTSGVWRRAAEQHHALAFPDRHRAPSFGFKVFDILKNKEERLRISYFAKNLKKNILKKSLTLFVLTVTNTRT